MKKIITLITCFTLLLILFGCATNSSNNNSGTADTSVPLDLTGLWVQKDAGETYMVATIQDGTIGVFFILEGDEEPWTYWVGTYVAPEEDIDNYNWTSINTYGGSGLLASSDTEKDFSYKNDTLFYTVSIDGQTGTVALIRGEWDTSNIPESAFSSVNSSTVDVKDIQIEDYGWLISDSGYLFYYITLYNPNSNIAISYPEFRITARDEENVLLGTEDQALMIIYPNQKITYGSQAFKVDESPSDVEFEILEVEDYNLTKFDANSYITLEAINVVLRSDKIVGEIDNKNDLDYDTVCVTALTKNDDGELISILQTFVSDLKANTTTPFEVESFGKELGTNVEVYVCEW